jgi:rhodanese-related sulfurtransferase
VYDNQLFTRLTHTLNQHIYRRFDTKGLDIPARLYDAEFKVFAGGFLDARFVKSVFRLAGRQGDRAPAKSPRLTPRDLALLELPGAVLVDLRPPLTFSAGFIPGSIHLPEWRSPAEWRSRDLLRIAGLSAEQRIYVLSDSPHEAERAAKFFERFGVWVAGWFGLQAVEDWIEIHGNPGVIEQITADTLAVRLAAWKTVVADFRDPAAFRAAHVPDAILMPLEDLTKAVAGLPKRTSLSLICETGKLCSFAASLLWNAGYRKLAIVKGGFAAYVEHGGLPMRVA